MLKLKHITTLITAVAILTACSSGGRIYKNRRYICDFEGNYWDSLVDSDPNGANLLNGTIPTSWCDDKSGLTGEVSQPYNGYWEGAALSNHCSKDWENDGQPNDQLYAYVDKAFSGKNFVICNAFMNSPFLALKNKSGFIGSMNIALTTYSYNATMNGNHITPALGASESIWIEAKGYINGSNDVQATAKFYLYENGKPAFEGWKKWYLTSMCEIDKIVFEIKWNGEGEYNPYPAYFAIDDIEVIQKEYIE